MIFFQNLSNSHLVANNIHINNDVVDNNNNDMIFISLYKIIFIIKKLFSN